MHIIYRKSVYGCTDLESMSSVTTDQDLPCFSPEPADIHQPVFQNTPTTLHKSNVALLTSEFSAGDAMLQPRTKITPQLTGSVRKTAQVKTVIKFGALSWVWFWKCKCLLRNFPCIDVTFPYHHSSCVLLGGNFQDECVEKNNHCNLALTVDNSFNMEYWITA